MEMLTRYGFPVGIVEDTDPWSTSNSGERLLPKPASLAEIWEQLQAARLPDITESV